MAMIAVEPTTLNHLVDQPLWFSGPTEGLRDISVGKLADISLPRELCGEVPE
jgi:hypothetical protein